MILLLSVMLAPMLALILLAYVILLVTQVLLFGRMLELVVYGDNAVNSSHGVVIKSCDMIGLIQTRAPVDTSKKQSMYNNTYSRGGGGESAAGRQACTGSMNDSSTHTRK